MHFDLGEAIEVLERTPGTLAYFLTGLSDGWLLCDEGEGTWNVTQVIEHLIEGEKTNWIPRLQILLREGENAVFTPFVRLPSEDSSHDRPIRQKLSEFKALRLENIARLKTLIHTDAQLELTGSHPAFGTVKARELLSTWVVHDFTHLAQIARVMAKRYGEDVGPWTAYLGILKNR
ncbi:DinB family protein [Cohnella candidum]|uniref:DinB family protein n=1 Tax=Cohnella candidum TaxID=2674991 RepID=A0A3G3K2V5_9BACL|nr:DinB family protein [Cohnella candidum]AYQ74826.1 DinB family protein [Cohnella candidum]